MTELSVVWSSGKTPVQAKHGVFDLRAESVYLTALHTLARCHRGAA